MTSAYEIWIDALVRSYTGERCGVRLGASYADVLKWLPMMRPYPTGPDHDADEVRWAGCAVTHVVYTLNDYSAYNLSPAWLPQEFAFLMGQAEQAVVRDDIDMLGEFLDTLKSFGLSDTHPLIQTGMRHVLSQQHPDGGWGDPESDDVYLRYHPTWTAIDGLREYAWRGTRISFPALRPFLTQCAAPT